jgi:hypothetical protein
MVSASVNLHRPTQRAFGASTEGRLVKKFGARR